MTSEISAQLRALQRERRLCIEMQRTANQRLDSFVASYVTALVPDDTRSYKAVLKIALNVRNHHNKGLIYVGYEIVQERVVDFLTLHQTTRSPWDDMRSTVEKQMIGLAKCLPVAPIIETVHGFGYLGLAIIAAEAYSPTAKGGLADYADVNNLFKRLGLAVIEGRRQGNPAGTGILLKEAWIAHGYVPQRRSEIWTIGHALMLKQIGGGAAKGPLRRTLFAQEG